MASNWGRKSRNYSDTTVGDKPAALKRGVFAQLQKAEAKSSASAGTLADRISRAMNTANEKTNFIRRDGGKPNAQ